MSAPIIPTTPKTPKQNKAVDLALDVDKPAGVTSIDDKMNFEVEELAQRAATELAAKISNESTLANEQGKTRCQIVYFDYKVASALNLYRTFQLQCSVLTRSFSSAKRVAQNALDTLTDVKRNDESNQPFLVRSFNMEKFRDFNVQANSLGAEAHGSEIGVLDIGLPSGLTAAANLLSLFAVDTEYHGRSASVSDRAFVMELAEMFKKQGCDFLWPSLSFSINSVDDNTNEPLYLSMLNQLTTAASAASEAIDKLASFIKELPEADPRFPAARQAIDRAHDFYNSSSAIYDGLRKRFFSNSVQNGLTSSELIQLGSYLIEILTEEKPSATPDDKDQTTNSETNFEQLNQSGNEISDLQVKRSVKNNVYFVTPTIEKAGGSFRIRKHLWQAITGEPPLTFSGGCIISYAILDHTGNFVKSGTVSKQMSYRSYPKRWNKDYDDQEDVSLALLGKFILRREVLAPIGLYFILLYLVILSVPIIANAYTLSISAVSLGVFIGAVYVSVTSRAKKTRKLNAAAKGDGDR